MIKVDKGLKCKDMKIKGIKINNWNCKVHQCKKSIKVMKKYKVQKNRTISLEHQVNSFKVILWILLKPHHFETTHLFFISMVQP